MSWPPASMPFSTNGCRLARAAYRAAVSPAGPEPRMMTFRSSATSWSILPYAQRGSIPVGRARGGWRGRRAGGRRPLRTSADASRGVLDEGAVRARGDPDLGPGRGVAPRRAREVDADIRQPALEPGVDDLERDRRRRQLAGPGEARRRTRRRGVEGRSPGGPVAWARLNRRAGGGWGRGRGRGAGPTGEGLGGVPRDVGGKALDGLVGVVAVRMNERSPPVREWDVLRPARRPLGASAGRRPRDGRRGGVVLRASAVQDRERDRGHEDHGGRRGRGHADPPDDGSPARAASLVHRRSAETQRGVELGQGPQGPAGRFGLAELAPAPVAAGEMLLDLCTPGRGQG